MDTRDVKRNSLTFWIGLGVILLITLNLPAPLSRGMKRGVRNLLAPLQELATSYTRRVRNAGEAIRGWGSLPERHEETRRELVEARRELVELEQLRDENRLLRRQLGFRDRARWELIAGNVLARDISGWWQSARVRVPTDARVRPGQAVLSSEGLVGKIREISGKTADVLLISDPACRVSVRVKNKNVFGILSGQGLSWRGRVHCRMELMNKDVTLVPGDEVVTSGLGGVFPGGIRVGRIESVQMDENNLHQSAEVAPAADLANLRVVFLIPKEEDA